MPLRKQTDIQCPNSLRPTAGAQVPSLLAATVAAAALSLFPQRSAANDLGKDTRSFTLVLPTWTELAQEIEIHPTRHDASPKDARVSANPADSTTAFTQTQQPHLPPLPLPDTEPPANAPPPTDSDDSASGAETDPISAHLLIPQAAPPMPEPVDFPEWTPASTIWIAGFSSKVDGERQEAEGDLATAIASFQNARGAYELVAKRFPDWQPDIVSYRLADLELRIRLLVQKTATASAAKKRQ